MPAECPSCHRPAVLDLHASMFHRARDFYSCHRCDETWAVDKRTGRMSRFPVAQAVTAAAASSAADDAGAGHVR